MSCWTWCCSVGLADTGRRAALSGQRGEQAGRRMPFMLIGLALIGLAVAAYDSYAIYTGQPLWCPPPVDGCNVVAASPYARIFGLPIGYYGVVYYAGMFGLAALLAFEPWSRTLRAAAVSYAALGVMFSLYFLVLQAGYIRAFCVYCAISALTTLLLVITAISHWNATRTRA